MPRALRTIALGVLTVGIISLSGQAQQTQSGAAQPQGQADQSGAPPPAAPGASPTFRGGIDFVRVDVIVSDKAGNPVSDLKATDFEVSEDGKPQKVETLSAVYV